MNTRITTQLTVTAVVAMLTVAGATSAAAEPEPGQQVSFSAILAVDPATCPVTELAGHLVRCDYVTGH